MKTVGFVKRPDGAMWWRNLPNSLPLDSTISTTTHNNRCILQFRVDHVHAAIDSEIRVLCLVPDDKVEGKGAQHDMIYKSTLFQQDQTDWWPLGHAAQAFCDAMLEAKMAWEDKKARNRKSEKKALTSYAEAARTAVEDIPVGAISDRDAAGLVASVLEAAGVHGPERRDEVLQLAAKEFATGDQVPGGSM
jgi:hypothetical protein